MTRTLLLVPIVLAGAVGCDPSPPGEVSGEELAGYWEGSFHILRDSVHLVLHLSEAESLVGDSQGSVSGAMEGLLSLPAQAVFDLPVDVDVEGREIRTATTSMGGRYEGRLVRNGSEIRGDWFQAGGKFRLSLVPTSTPPHPIRPQTPVPPFPYRSEEVRIDPSGGGVVLSGTLTVPEGVGPFPAVVLVSGSGPQDRDETLFGHKPFMVLADHLTREGIAVLRYDDRGVGDSRGDFAQATSEDFATDALAAVEYLASHSSVDPDRVGIVGHSEGGIVAPMAAVRSDRVAFIVSMAGTGISGRDLLELQTRLILEASQVPASVIALNRRIQDEVFDKLLEAGTVEGALELARGELEASGSGLPYAAMNALGLAAQVDRAMEEQLRAVASPWFFFFLTFDPTTAFERVTVPVLALNGTLDLQVPPDPNLFRIREALERGGNPNGTIVELDGLNHLFQHAETGLPSEYGLIEETMAQEVLELIAGWILDFGAPTSEKGRS